MTTATPITMPVNQPTATELIKQDQNNYLLEVFLNNTDSSVIITDTNFNITFYNKLAEYSAEQFVKKTMYIGMPLLDLALPERKESQLTLFKNVLKGNYFENEYTIELPEKDFVCFNVNYHPAKNNDGEIVGILISSKNITERKKREEELRISDERFQLIVKATSDAIWDYDVINSRIYFNESFTRYFGHDPRNWANGYDLWERHIHPDDKERVITKINASINGTDNYWQDKYRFVTNNGSVVYVYDRGMIVRNEAGDATRMIGSMQDISTQINVNKEKELLINELTKNVQDLRQFSYITSHNLRAPISNLIGIMNLINMDMIPDKDTRFLVEKFKESTYILNETVNDLLNILLIKNNVNVKKEVFHLDQLWQDVCTSVSSQVQKAEARIDVDFSNGDEINFNKTYADSILLNLLTNSLKYRHKERKLHISLKTFEEGEYLVLRFADNGIGINMDHHREKIFGLYQRFHNYPDSKGLGLYIVHSQVTALGGKIEVDSAPDKGTSFKICFKK